MFDKLRTKLRDFSKSIEHKISEKGKAALEGETVLTEKDLKEPLEYLETALLESDVALSVVEELIAGVKGELAGKRKKWGVNTVKLVKEAIRDALVNVVNVDKLDFDEFVDKSKKPVNIVFVGVNGTGKTTSIAKVAKKLLGNGHSVVLASADTYRAGATEQIEEHASNLGIRVVKHQYGADPTAVVYDAVKYAEANKMDVVLADTAGRMHTAINLMEQLKKICRVTKPDLVIFVDEAMAGNDAVERAKKFDDAVGIDGSILAKTDVDAKGGTAISIAHSTSKPILFLGIGQGYDDLVTFDTDWLVDRLLGNNDKEAKNVS
uniref:Signal recognition particle receptor FtsY n=1 Tax=Candidatus Methanophagaceae archaeon ANME-1 ERB6 TaxID=2759912 RepID=A0A7G9YTU8_9EURY|nr:signal recognition particle receptor FtsY [Methanosarcinales archaeon ANME-1 ERB6]